MRKLFTLYIFLLFLPIWSDDEKKRLDLSAEIDLHAEKYTKMDDHNIDKLYGRANLTAKAEKKNFDGQITIRAYPSGFGYEEPREVNEDPADLSRFQVMYAWFKRSGKWVDATIGRQELFSSSGIFFGNYLDEGAENHFFMGKGVRGNALKLEKHCKWWSKTSLSLGIQNSNADDGYVRFYQTFIPFKSKKLQIHGGYRANLFDHVHQPDSKLHHNFVFAFDYKVLPEIKFFSELGFLDVQNRNLANFPLLVGSTLPSKEFFDRFQWEVEYIPDPENILGRKDNPLLWSIYGQKDFSNHYRLNLGFFSANKEIDHLGIGFRFTGRF